MQTIAKCRPFPAFRRFRLAASAIDAGLSALCRGMVELDAEADAAAAEEHPYQHAHDQETCRSYRRTVGHLGGCLICEWHQSTVGRRWLAEQATARSEVLA